MVEIQRRERAEKPRLEHQHQAKVEARRVTHAVRRVHRHQRHHRRQHQHQRAQRIHAQVIFNAQRRRPRGLLQHADRPIHGQPRPHHQRHNQAHQRSQQRHIARMLARPESNGGAHQRQHGQQRQYRKSAHARLLQIRIATSATTANASNRR